MLFCITFLFDSHKIFASENKALVPKKLKWPFEGIFGTFDRISAQRGAKVYFEVCSACHGMQHLYYRNLIKLGFSEEEIEELAKSYTVLDGPDEEGEMYNRPAIPSDHIVSPFANDEMAKASNNGAIPPDLSLIFKARSHGANYIFSLLTGYEETKPEEFELNSALFYNPYFEGRQVAMSPPLRDGILTFDDGTEATIEQMAKDVVVFLQWSAEPEMEHRKSMGLKALLFLSAFTVLFYFSMRNIWKKIQQ